MNEPAVSVPSDISAPQDPAAVPFESPFFLDTPLLSPIVAPPAFNGTQPYVISNYVIGGLDMLLLVVSVLCVALQLRKKKGLRDGGPSMLFVHVGLFAAARGILVFLPPKVYANIIKNPALQTILNIVPEILFLSIFVILNCMWTEIFLRIRKVNRELTRKIFLWSYFVGLAVLLVLGVILVVSVKATGIGLPPVAAPEAADAPVQPPVGMTTPVAPPSLPLEYQPTTYENIYYAVAALVLLVANIVFGFGILRRLPNLTPVYTQRLFSKIKKIQALVLVTFGCVIVKVIFLFLMQSFLRQAWRNGIISRDVFGFLWFCYLFFTEVFAIALILGLFLFRRPQKSGKAYIDASSGSTAQDQVEYNEYTNLMRVRQY